LLQQIFLLRLLRLARLARMVRLMQQFKVLWLLVCGLMHSLQTLFWTFVIVGIQLYMFAIAGVEFIQEDPDASDDYNAAVRETFGTLSLSYLTLLDGLTLDNLGDVYRPLVLEKPWIMIYFIAYILIVCIAMMNLITAIMVQSSIGQAAEEREVQHAWEVQNKKRILEELSVLFVQLDKDGSGLVDLDELRDAPPEVKARLSQILLSDDPAEIARVFHTLDYDNSGTVSVEEFCDGLSRILSGTPMELVSVMKQCKDIMATSQRQAEDLDELVTHDRALERSQTRFTPADGASQVFVDAGNRGIFRPSGEQKQVDEMELSGDTCKI